MQVQHQELIVLNQNYKKSTQTLGIIARMIYILYLKLKKPLFV